MNFEGISQIFNSIFLDHISFIEKFEMSIRMSTIEKVDVIEKNPLFQKIQNVLINQDVILLSQKKLSCRKKWHIHYDHLKPSSIHKY